MMLGRYGEDLAVEYICRKGYKVLVRNFRTKIGEIDVIAVDDNTLVFCEVKTRRNTSRGHPIEAISKKKQATIRIIAEVYLAMIENHHSFHEVRFDVVAILLEGTKTEIDHIENAF